MSTLKTWEPRHVTASKAWERGDADTLLEACDRYVESVAEAIAIRYGSLDAIGHPKQFGRNAVMTANNEASGAGSETNSARAHRGRVALFTHIPGACYEFGRKPHWDAHSPVGSVPRSPPFSAFLSRS
jgi:hypothetical protein